MIESAHCNNGSSTVSNFFYPFVTFPSKGWRHVLHRRPSVSQRDRFDQPPLHPQPHPSQSLHQPPGPAIPSHCNVRQQRHQKGRGARVRFLHSTYRTRWKNSVHNLVLSATKFFTNLISHTVLLLTPTFSGSTTARSFGWSSTSSSLAIAPATSAATTSQTFKASSRSITGEWVNPCHRQTTHLPRPPLRLPTHHQVWSLMQSYFVCRS